MIEIMMMIMEKMMMRGEGGDYHIRALVFKHLTDSGLTSSHERRHGGGDFLVTSDYYGVYHAA